MSRKKRRTYSAKFKLYTVMEGLQGKKEYRPNLPRTGDQRHAVLQMAGYFP